MNLERKVARGILDLSSASQSAFSISAETPSWSNEKIFYVTDALVSMPSVTSKVAFPFKVAEKADELAMENSGCFAFLGCASLGSKIMKPNRA